MDMWVTTCFARGGSLLGSGVAQFFTRNETSLQPEYCLLRFGFISPAGFPGKLILV
jgi:hypothetical protein